MYETIQFLLRKTDVDRENNYSRILLIQSNLSTYFVAIQKMIIL